MITTTNYAITKHKKGVMWLLISKNHIAQLAIPLSKSETVVNAKSKIQRVTPISFICAVLNV